MREARTVVVPVGLVNDISSFLALWNTTRAQELISALDAALAAAPQATAGVGEPVAWQSRPIGGQDWSWSALDALPASLSDTHEYRPLYASPPPSEAVAPITMQDVRLAVGEGKLTADDVLAGCNAEIRRRALLNQGRAG